MIYSTSSSNRPVRTRWVLALVLLASCAVLGRQEGEPLELTALVADTAGPAVARGTLIRWRASATGGSGKLSYRFTTRRGDSQVVEQKGPLSTWDWRLDRTGTFRVRVTVEDARGVQVDSDWSPAYIVKPGLTRASPIALLPIENLSGKSAPLGKISASLRVHGNENGVQFLAAEVLDPFMRQHRIRYTGGIDSVTARAFRDELQTEGVLITSLESYQDAQPPKISLTARLVVSGDSPDIVWMDAVGLSGDDSPGLLELGLISEPDVLLDNAVSQLMSSLASFLWLPIDDVQRPPSHESPPPIPKVASMSRWNGRHLPSKYQPRVSFRSPIIDTQRRYTLAVIPFLNLTARRGAGDIVTLHFVNELLRQDRFVVTEPGLVRQELLKYRMIMQAGPSLANADILFSPQSLGADLVLSGRVFDYQDAVGTPKVDFSVEVFEKSSRELVWSSRSFSTGDEGVVVFDFGRVRSAHRLAAAMARATCRALSR